MDIGLYTEIISGPLTKVLLKRSMFFGLRLPETVTVAHLIVCVHADMYICIYMYACTHIIHVYV